MIITKAIKIENQDVIAAVNAGSPYIEVGNRRFLLIEVDQFPKMNIYEVTDKEEERLLLEALEGENPILSDMEVDKMLGCSEEL